MQINDKVGFNPEMRSLKEMYDNGNVAIVQGVGYPQPDHSHFRSTEIWQTAAPDRYESTGWLGRYLDAAELPGEQPLQRGRRRAGLARSDDLAQDGRSGNRAVCRATA